MDMFWTFKLSFAVDILVFLCFGYFLKKYLAWFP